MDEPIDAAAAGLPGAGAAPVAVTTTHTRHLAFDAEPQTAVAVGEVVVAGAPASSQLHAQLITVQQGAAVALDMERVQQQQQQHTESATVPHARAATPGRPTNTAHPSGGSPQTPSRSPNNQRHSRSAREGKDKGKGGAHVVQRSSPSDGFDGRYAVDARGVQHSYDGKKQILQKLDLQIEPGQIYGLLGPSGCGKTTLIRCLLASLTPSEGSIRVFGEEPGSVRSEVPGHDVGYMPQEIALYEEFTILQNLSFYGKLHNMSGEEIKDRSEYLCKLLDIDDVKGRNVTKLSGGQQRRVSLACGLLHSPKLLILDEPTVGVDPTLRTKIWKYLTKMSREEGTTVLLTTHYIEEARQAHRVGLMRDGKMLKQGTPREIMKQTQSRTLEQAFLKICKKDEKDEKKEDGKDEEEDDKEDDGLDSPSAKSSSEEEEEEDEAEATALNQGSVSAAGDDSSSRGPKRRARSSPSGEGGARSPASYDESDKDASALPSKRSRDSSGKATFAGITNADYHEPLLTRSPSPPSGAGWAKSNKSGGDGKRHLQSPNPDEGMDDDDDAEERNGGGKNGTSNKSRDGNRAPPLKGWDKVAAALALPRWPQLWALCWKNLLRMAKGVAALIFQFVLPSIQVILFCVAIGKDPQHIKFGVVDLDATGPLFTHPSSAQLALPENGGLSGDLDLAAPSAWRGYLPDSVVSSYSFLHSDPDPDPKPTPANFLSAQLIRNLDEHFVVRRYADLSAAQAAVRTNDAWGYIHIPTNFTRNTLERINQTIHTPGAVSNQTIANSTLTYTLDMSNEQMTVFLMQSILGSYTKLIEHFAPQAIRDSPIQQGEPVYGDADANFTDFVAPGIIITITFSGSIGLTAISFVIDRRIGNLDRIWSSGVRASEVMLAQVLTQLLIFVVQVGLLLIFGLLVFKLPSEGSVFLLFCICVMLAVTGMMFGLVIASKVTEERDAMQTSLGLFFPALLLSGVMWPVEAIPIPLYWLSLGLPTTWAAEAGRSIMSRGWGLEHRQVWLGLVVPAAWSFVFFVWAAKSLRPKK